MAVYPFPYGVSKKYVPAVGFVTEQLARLLKMC